MKNEPQFKRLLRRHGLDAVCIVLCAVAFVHGVRATQALEYPYDIDFYVHLSHAQSALDGYFLVDPYYLNEMQWYNPLVSWLIAAVTWIFGIPLTVACTRMGAYLNLLAPLCFYALSARLLGKWAAAAAVLSFLFLAKPFLPGCYLGTYSPWLYSNNFMQAFFYLGLLVYIVSLKKKNLGWAAAAGILLGIAFLGHAGTALILGFVIGIMELRNMVLDWKASGGSRKAFGRGAVRIGILFGLAFIVSLPFLYSILFHYRLKILNDAPNGWMPFFLRLENLQFFWTVNRSKRNLVALFGIVVLVFQPHKALEKRILFFWACVCIVFLAYCYLGQVMTRLGAHLFCRVPAYHFFFYLNAVLSLFFGYGLARSADFLADLGRRIPLLPMSVRPFLGGRVILSLLMLLCFARYYPSYGSRFDYTEAPARSRAIAGWSDWRRTHDWIRVHTHDSEVFLANDMWGMYVVGPSGRKSVAIWNLCSNPYVDWRGRNADRETMVAFLTGKAGDIGEFMRLVSKYGVRFILADPDEWRISKDLPFLKKEFSGDKVEIYRIVQ